jgi:DNA polymerase V
MPAGPDQPDRVLDEIDLTDYLVLHPDSTFLIRVKGESMKDLGILPGDLIVVDRVVRPTAKSIVVVKSGGRTTIRMFSSLRHFPRLVSDKGTPAKRKQSEVWGVVVGVVRKF